MSLKDKYKQLIDAATSAGVSNLQVTEQNNVLYVNGTTSSSNKDKLWKIYNQIDPDMRAADMVLDITDDGSASEAQTYTVVSGDSLSKIATKYDGISWKDIFNANTDQLKDPDKIFPGQVLKIPQK